VAKRISAARSLRTESAAKNALSDKQQTNNKWNGQHISADRFSFIVIVGRDIILEDHHYNL
jgi:hypothetical protein